MARRRKRRLKLYLPAARLYLDDLEIICHEMACGGKYEIVLQTDETEWDDVGDLAEHPPRGERPFTNLTVAARPKEVDYSREDRRRERDEATTLAIDGDWESSIYAVERTPENRGIAAAVEQVFRKRRRWLPKHVVLFLAFLTASLARGFWVSTVVPRRSMDGQPWWYRVKPHVGDIVKLIIGGVIGGLLVHWWVS